MLAGPASSILPPAPCAQVRRSQRQRLAWTATEEGVLENLRCNKQVLELFRRLRPDIASGELAPRSAAELLALQFAQYD